MRGRELLRKFDLSEEEINRRAQKALGKMGTQQLDKLYEESVRDVKSGSIVAAKVIGIVNNEVVVDFGGKSEGSISVTEWDAGNQPGVGDQFEVFYEGQNEETQTATVSKKRADRMRAWDRVVHHYKPGDIVKGVAQKKIKGGLLVMIDDVPVFLPSSQINLRRTQDMGDLIGRDVECEIIKIDTERMNIVVSRRKLLERVRSEAKGKLLGEIEEGQVRKGIVKNIADFGVFVDLGGIDGLLHITDMSWGRIKHPSEMVSLDEEIDVKVLRVDKEKERIALGLKQRITSPWENIEAKYPVASRHHGEVVNIMSYGAFIKLEDGVEGLVHVSEMSWTKRVNHPSEVVQLSDTVEVIVLEINKDKQEISLGMKQAEANPWDTVAERYPIGTIIEGKVRNLTNYGAFVEIEEGIDGLLHVSDMSWTKKITHPGEMIKKGDVGKFVVLSIDGDKKRIALGLKQLENDPWQDTIPANYHVGDLVTGHVTKITNFGVFVKLEENLEGLLHISELSDKKIATPEEVVKVGMKIEVRVIKIDPEERKIGLSFVHSDFEENKKILEKKESKKESKKDKKEAKGAEGETAAETEPAESTTETPSEPAS